ncbi:Proteasome subunit alpha 1 [Cichlidogyrus casuarinus]|uniref:Proteasome subunit alpha 1 n=1 Tax=Cichlidogyrus casuarinus TaxID=1844966 RepID=A0ABD2QCW2_9PLAT
MELSQRRTDAHSRALARVTEQELPSVSAEDEVQLVKRYLFIMKRLFDSFQSPVLPDRVYGFAAHYLKRFYLAQSMMDHYPREIMLTCLYLGCKCADFPIGVRAFVQHIPRNQERYSNFIVNSELFIIDAINYDLFVHTPYRPFKGLVVDFISYSFQTGRVQMADAKTLYDELLASGIDTIHKWFQTDLCFSVGPSEYALAVLVQIPDLFRKYDLDIEAFIRDELCGCDPMVKLDKYSAALKINDGQNEETAKKQEKEKEFKDDDDDDDSSDESTKEEMTGNMKPAEQWELLRQNLKDIQDYINEFKFVESLAPIENEVNPEEILEQCRNPLYNPGTSEYEEARSVADNSLL